MDNILIPSFSFIIHLFFTVISIWFCYILPSILFLPSQCHSNERLGVVRSKIASCARVPIDQVQNLSFGEGSNSFLVTGGEQDNRLLHSIGVHTNTTVTAKISSSGAQLKEASLSACSTINLSCQKEAFHCRIVFIFFMTFFMTLGIYAIVHSCSPHLVIAACSCLVIKEVEFVCVCVSACMHICNSP